MKTEIEAAVAKIVADRNAACAALKEIAQRSLGDQPKSMADLVIVFLADLEGTRS
jgi:hypothetical protein